MKPLDWLLVILMCSMIIGAGLLTVGCWNPNSPTILDCGSLRPVFGQRWDGSLYIAACVPW